jgi:acetyl-CoA synthetase
MKLEYQKYEEANKFFKWDDRWGVFDNNRDSLNIAYECVDRHPKDKTAIRLQKSDGSRESYSFGELSLWTSQFAYILEKWNVNQGDRIAIVLNPSLEFYVAFFGALKRGVVVVPCYPLLGPDGIGYRIKTSNSKLVIISKERAKIVPSDIASNIIISEDLMGLISKENTIYEPKTSADTLAVIQFSSGTTGQPKPAHYKHMAMSTTAVYVKLWIGLQERDRYLCTSSPAWGHGIWYGTVGPMIFGNGIGAYSGKFYPEVLLEGLVKFNITVISASPRVYKLIMETGKIEEYDLNIRRLTYAGDSIDKDVARYFLDKLGLFICSSYGTTESGPIAIDYAFDDWKPKIGSAGKAVFGTKVGILDEIGNELPPGEIGHVAVWRHNKWNPIGDYGYIDEEGYLFPKGRSDDVIKSSGYRIGPFDIESTLEKHSAVKKAAAVGSPDKDRGEIVKAFIVVRSNVDKSEALINELKIFVKDHLSMHEYPREIEFVDTIPETPDGKLQRKVLKKLEYDRKGRLT